MAAVGFEPGTSSSKAKVLPAGENTKRAKIEAIAGIEEDWEALGLDDSLVEGVERIMGERSGESVVRAVTGEADSGESNDEGVENGRWAGVSSGLEETVTTQSSSSHAEILDAEVCCLLPSVFCLLSAVCCLLSTICCLLSAVCCLLSAVCCLLSAVCYLHSL
jgi:hypothetical protein